MELHVSLSCVVPNAPWVEYNPQLERIAHNRMLIENGCALPPDLPKPALSSGNVALAEQTAFCNSSLGFGEVVQIL